MNIKETRKLQELIYNIYYNGEDPAKFGEATGIKDYMEELYPKDTNKLVGDWISNKFSPKAFLREDELQDGLDQLKKLYRKTIYYANIPNGKTLENVIGELRRVIEEGNTNVSGSQDI